MKTLSKYLIAMVGLCVLLTSCKIQSTDNYTRDMSIAGTVSDGSYFYKGAIECKQSEQTICDGVRYYMMAFDKVSDEKAGFWFRLEYPDTLVYLSISNIPLSGVPLDVNFDYTTAQGVVRINNIEYSSVTLRVSGWIKDTEILRSRSIVLPDYDSEISISGKVADKDFTLTMSGTTAPK